MKRYTYYPSSDFIKEHLRGRKILDIGNLGRNGSTHKKIREFFPDSEITGLDINKERAKEFNFPNQVIGNAEELPFSNNYFDGIFMGEILEHTFEPCKMIGEARRVLRKGGILVATTPNAYSLNKILRFLLKRAETTDVPDHKILYTPAIFRDMFEKNGFKVEIISTNVIRIKSVRIYFPKLKMLEMLGGNLLVKAIKK